MKKYLLGAIFVFGFIYVFFFSYIPDSYKMLFKLIPMILIILLAGLMTPINTKKYKTIIIIALIFCAIGDYTLQWFLIGLSSFLIGHLFYIYAFSTRSQLKKLGILQYIIIIYGIAMIALMGGTLFYKGDTLLATMVILYIFVIVTMGTTSVSTKNKLAIAGALLFIFSDSILAINKFLVAVPFSHQFIMFSYYSAQLLLALSIGNKLEMISDDTIEENRQ